MKKNIFLNAVCIFSAVLIMSCNSVRKDETQPGLWGIKITENFPSLNENGKLLGLDTFSTNIYYYGDKELYHSSYHFDSVSAGKQLISENREYYFVYKKGNPYGLLFDSGKHIFGKSALVDSVLEKEWCNGLNFYRSFTDNVMTPLSSIENADSGIVKKEFSFTGIKDTGLSGHVTLWFSRKLTHIPYSFSKELDSMYNMKLYKIRAVNNPRKLDGYDFALEKIEQAFDIEEIPVTNKPDLLKYFEKTR